ncbi:unnamed protein product [Rotaria sp. Silwood1]|nr:unnamed protein product [Rotaria sp. Silwood1]
MLDTLFKIIQHQSTQSSRGLLIPLEDIEKLILQIITSISNITKSDYQFSKRCEEYFGYVEPLQIKLNDQDDCGYYVPIQQSIKRLLSKPDVITYLVNNLNDNITQTKNDPDLMLIYRDGTVAKDNPSLKLHPNSFLIQLYSDGIGVTNPIGPKKDEHKLTVYYFVLEDLPDVVRSMLQSIGLVGICPTKYVSLQTNRIKYFEPIVKDLNYLQTTGFTVQTFDGQLHFAFSLLAADNLASHEIGDFQRNFNSGQFCHLCHISYQFRLTLLTDISFLPRIVTTHNTYVQQATNSFNRRTIASVVEEEIGEVMLARLPFDELRALFPKLKDRVLFTEKRDILIKENNNTTNEQLDGKNILNESSTQDLLDDIPLFCNDMNNETSGTTSNIDCQLNEDENGNLEESQQNLSSDFAFVSLQEEIQVIVDENDLMKLREHTNHRRILLNFVFKIVVNTYNLLYRIIHMHLVDIKPFFVYFLHMYPKASDYFLITQTLLKTLKISTPDANATNEWREAIKQKLKNERRLLQKISPVVQRKKEKFGKGCGCYAKKSQVLSAERQHEKMIYVSSIMDECDIEQLVTTMKESIQNGTIHNDVLNTLWKKTFGYRRLFISSHTTNEILEKFPGYSYPCLIFEEIKMIDNVDIEKNVNKILPRLFDKLPNNELFIMGDHILVENEPIVPTPCIKVSNEKFQLYLDWQVVAKTTSPTTALSLLLSIYNVFELEHKKSQTQTTNSIDYVCTQTAQQLQVHSTATTTESAYSFATLNTGENESPQSPQSIPLIIPDQEQQPHNNSLLQIHESEQNTVGIQIASSTAVHSRIIQRADTKIKFSNSSNIQHKVLKDATNSKALTAATKGGKRKLLSSPKQRKLSSRLAIKRSRQNVSSFKD